MPHDEKDPPAPADMTEFTQASVLAEAAANLAAQAAARAEAARARAEEARARAEAIRAQRDEPSDTSTEAAPEPLTVLASAVEATEPAAAEPEATPEIDRRAAETRRSTPDRRIHDIDTRPQPAPERRSNLPRRRSDGRRATDLTDNSGIIRLGDAVRAAVSAQSADRLSNRPELPAAQPGELMEPLGHSAGLHPYRRPRRSIFSPGFVLLIGLMLFFGLYATGNLPQFDRWTDNAVHNTQAHNTEVVGFVVNSWRLIAGGAAAICALLIVLLILNAVRARSNNND